MILYSAFESFYFLFLLGSGNQANSVDRIIRSGKDVYEGGGRGHGMLERGPLSLSPLIRASAHTQTHVLI